MDQPTLEIVQQVIEEVLGIDPKEAIPSAALINDLGADSLDVVELGMAFEERFDIEIADEDVEKLVTVQDVLDYLLSRAGEGRIRNVQA